MILKPKHEPSAHNQKDTSELPRLTRMVHLLCAPWSFGPCTRLRAAVCNQLSLLVGMRVCECGKRHFIAEPSTLRLIPLSPKNSQAGSCLEVLSSAVGCGESWRK